MNFTVPRNNASGFVTTFTAGPNGTTTKSLSSFPPILVENLVPGERYDVIVYAQGHEESKGESSEVVEFVVGELSLHASTTWLSRSWAFEV